MKVLFVADLEKISNPFVKTLTDAIIACGCNVTCSQNEFWVNPLKYDIIHFQWPELLFDWRSNISNDEVEHLQLHLEKIKKASVLICITCHNLKPHMHSNSNLIKAFDIIYGACDCFFHMGSYSEKIIQAEYPDAKHVIVPHHLYDKIFQFDENVPVHKWIEAKKSNVLSFGAFRNNKERELLEKLVDDKSFRNVNFIAPGFWMKGSESIIERIKVKFFRNFPNLYRIKSNKKFLSDFETEQLFTHADIILIQRLSILNSGNLPMAFAAGKVVAGPNVGNVGAILRETGNPTFDPYDYSSIADALKLALELSKGDLGYKNRQYAIDNWSSQIIATKIIETYKSL